MAPVPPGNLIFLQVQQTRLVRVLNSGTKIHKQAFFFPGFLIKFNTHQKSADEYYATHISQYKSPFQKIHVVAPSSSTTTTTHHQPHCRHPLHESLSRHWVFIRRFLDQHPQVVTLLLVACLVLLLHVLLSSLVGSSRTRTRNHDDDDDATDDDDNKSRSLNNRIDNSEIRKEG